jgi:hypothetical protein
MNPDEDPPIDPPKKKGFLGTLQKKGTLCKRKRSTSLAPTADATHAHAEDVAGTNVIRRRLEAKGARRKMSKADLEAKLKRVFVELDLS